MLQKTWMLDDSVLVFTCSTCITPDSRFPPYMFCPSFQAPDFAHKSGGDLGSDDFALQYLLCLMSRFLPHTQGTHAKHETRPSSVSLMNYHGFDVILSFGSLCNPDCARPTSTSSKVYSNATLRCWISVKGFPPSHNLHLPRT